MAMWPLPSPGCSKWAAGQDELGAAVSLALLHVIMKTLYASSSSSSDSVGAHWKMKEDGSEAKGSAVAEPWCESFGRSVLVVVPTVASVTGSSGDPYLSSRVVLNKPVMGWRLTNMLSGYCSHLSTLTVCPAQTYAVAVGQSPTQ